MISNKERVGVLFLLLIIGLSGVYIFKGSNLVLEKDQSIVFKKSYQPSFVENLLLDLNLASAYASLDANTTGRVPYIEVMQHDDMYQLSPSESGKIRKDFVPDYARLASVAARSSGKWSEVFGGYKFNQDTIVLIPEGINIVYDIESSDVIKGIAIKGKLTIDPSKNTSMKVGTIILYSNASYEDRPMNSVNHKITFSGLVDKSIDPYQMTIGFVSIGGSVDIQGKDVKEYSRIASASGNQLTLDSASGLNVGDSIIIYESANLNKANLKQQVLKINSIQGNSLTLNNPININVGKFAILASRNVTFQSDSKGDRGHMMFLGDTSVSLKNIAVIDLGRTTTSSTVSAKKVGDTYIPGENQIGRYPIHAHHLQKKFVIEGSVVYGLREENIYYYSNLSRRVIDSTPLSVYVYTGKDPLGGQMDPVVWPTSHDVVASSNGRWWLLFNPVGELPAPTADATGFAPYKTRIGGDNSVEVLSKDNSWIKTGWIKYKAVVKNGKIYADSTIDTNISVISTPIASPKWAIVSHNSFGDIRNNAVIGSEGSGITTEEGLESGRIDANLVVGLGGGTGEHDDKRWWGFGLKKLDLGYGGVAFWHASMVPEITNNIADGLFRFGVYVVYHPYDINGAVPSINNANQYAFPNVPGMPEQLTTYKGFTSGIMKFENNTSYAESGHDASSLMLINIGSSDFETTNPHNLVSNFTAYHKGMTIVSMAPITFSGLKLYGDGGGTGVNAGDTESTLINSEVKNFSNGVNYDRHSMNILDSVVDNVKNNPQARAKIYYDSLSKKKDRISKNKDTYTKEALKENKDANFIAVLDHDNVYNQINKDEYLKGWATIDVDREKQIVTLKWNLHDSTSPLVNIDVVVPSNDRGIPAIIPDKLKRVFMVTQESTKYGGSYVVTKADIESGRYFPGKYNGAKPVSFEEFISYLNKGMVEIRFITNHIRYVDSGAWIEAQGNFFMNKTLPIIGEVKPVDKKFITTSVASTTQTTISVGQIPKSIDSKPAGNITQPSLPVIPPVIKPSSSPSPTPAPTPTPTPQVSSPANTASQSVYTKAGNGFTIQGGDPTISATKLTSGADKASTNTFSPGSYNNNPNDWAWDVSINTPAGRKIYEIYITDGENTWSTIKDYYWPLVAFRSGVQMHTKWSDPFIFTDPGINTFVLYGQQKGTTYKPVKITVVFDQGDTIVLDGVK